MSPVKPTYICEATGGAGYIGSAVLGTENAGYGGCSIIWV